ncbi:MAG: ROK family protein [Cyclobacteriaceae bacterium]|jgi:glucokinase|nr:ROK family protein [Cyclobacteriaceae bacterium]MDH5248818.1 ROK family protein [Cyclobacteriaceae bacterium]
MAILALDLGGTKVAAAVFTSAGRVVFKEAIPLEGRRGNEVGKFINTQIEKQMQSYRIDAIGISVPGISRVKTGTVWAPNIEGWEDYPLLEEMKKVAGVIPVSIDSDRACSIFGEQWQGNAKGCSDVIFMAVGTGIGAGILMGGNLLRGSQDIAGAIGWMALPKPFENKYIPCGCFEFYASGAGIPKLTNEVLQVNPAASILREVQADQLTAHHVFEAFDKKDEIASIIINECITYWGMATSNLVSIFNPEKIIFGGGIFGPAARFIDKIKEEASKWAQPISITQVSFEKSALGSEAAVYGAGFLALKNAGEL